MFHLSKNFQVHRFSEKFRNTNLTFPKYLLHRQVLWECDQCDQMIKLLFQYFAIKITENLPNTIIHLAK